MFTLQELKEYLDYNPETGKVYWRKSPAHAVQAGKEAGCFCKSSGRYLICFRSKLHHAGRLIWFYMTGQWPEGVIDHKDRNPLNNRWDNLRDVDKVINNQNSIVARSHNKCGYRGVSTTKWGFQARIFKNKVIYQLGYYPTAEEAHEAYMKAKRELHTFTQ